MVRPEPRSYSTPTPISPATTAREPASDVRASVGIIIEIRPAAGSEDDVDLGMAEEPEQVLPEQRVAAALGDEERPVESPLELEQRRAAMIAGKAKMIISADDEHRPGEDGHPAERHARGAGEQDADDQLDRASDRRDLDKADAEQPEVGAGAGRVLARS